MTFPSFPARVRGRADGGRELSAGTRDRRAARLAIMRACGVLAAGAVSGCAAAVVVPPRAAGPQASAACVVAAGEPRDSVIVAVAQPVDPASAPVPRNASERLVFRQLYETLVRVDCEGLVQPALAGSWSTDETGRTWQFRLRAGARFADGSPVTAADVVASWAAAGAADARTIAGIASVAEHGDDAVRVVLRTPARAAHVFAHAGLAVARPAAGGWPAGTGGYRIDTPADRRALRLIAVAQTPSVPRILEFRSSPDPRASLDAGVDALVTADAVALAYGRALRDYTALPLPWSRTYVLLTAPRGVGEAPAPAAAELEALAAGALHGDARAAAQPFWWQDPVCRPAHAPVPPGGSGAAVAGDGAIVYARGDAAARAVAERLVALAWPAARTPAWLRALLPAGYAARATAPTAVALDPGALHDALRGRDGLAFVLALPRTGGDACAAPVVAGDAALHALLGGVPGWRVTPLLDGRDHLVHRAGLGRILADADGALLFGAPWP
jgi:hypothetical protein